MNPTISKLEGFTRRFVVRGDGCWQWIGRLDRYGYGRYTNTRLWGNQTLAHRIAYVLAGGKLIKGMHLDHLCRYPACVNPKHLEQVTPAVNSRRGLAGALNRSKTHCVNGHEFTPENTRPNYGRRIHRTCITCERASLMRYYYKKKGKLGL